MRSKGQTGSVSSLVFWSLLHARKGRGKRQRAVKIGQKGRCSNIASHPEGESHRTVDVGQTRTQYFGGGLRNRTPFSYGHAEQASNGAGVGGASVAREVFRGFSIQNSFIDPANF
jgi:hypothetical protein